MDNLHDPIIELQIAEYNAMTMRHTYLLNIQILLVTVGIAWAVFFGTIWDIPMLDEFAS